MLRGSAAPIETVHLAGACLPDTGGDLFEDGVPIDHLPPVLAAWKRAVESKTPFRIISQYYADARFKGGFASEFAEQGPHVTGRIAEYFERFSEGYKAIEVRFNTMPVTANIGHIFRPAAMYTGDYTYICMRDDGVEERLPISYMIATRGKGITAHTESVNIPEGFDVGQLLELRTPGQD